MLLIELLLCLIGRWRIRHRCMSLSKLRRRSKSTRWNYISILWNMEKIWVKRFQNIVLRMVIMITIRNISFQTLYIYFFHSVKIQIFEDILKSSYVRWKCKSFYKMSFSEIIHEIDKFVLQEQRKYYSKSWCVMCMLICLLEITTVLFTRTGINTARDFSQQQEKQE